MPADALAQEQAPGSSVPIAFSADVVRLDTRSQALDVSGHVQVEQPPFFLSSDGLKLRRVPLGVELDGAGRLTFCPCLGSPLAVRFTQATVGPPHDVLLRNPVLEVFGVPVAWLPLFWLRSPGRAGVVPPELAFRGVEGFYAGDGIHVPWVAGDTEQGLDLRVGRYLAGGEAVSAALFTSSARAELTWDHFRGQDGVIAAARGSSDGASFRVDALRGARALAATSDVEAAARAWDRADASASVRAGGFTFASGFAAAAVRGGELTQVGQGGPSLTARAAGALGSAVAYDLTLEGGQVSGSAAGDMSFARGEGGAFLAGHLGPLLASMTARAAGDVGDEGDGARGEGLAQLRVRASVPLSRAFGGDGSQGRPGGAWVHRTEPYVSAAALETRPLERPWIPLPRGASAPRGAAWVSGAGFENALGRWADRQAAQLDVGGGAVGDDKSASALLRVRGAVQANGLAAYADVARVVSRPGRGGAARLAVTLGPSGGAKVGANLFERDGADPLLARTLVDGAQDPAGGFASASSFTGGAQISLPLGPRLTAHAGADIDFDSQELIAAAGALDFHDPCECVAVRLSGSRRLGRSGTDVWLAVDWPLGQRGRGLLP